jgi:hypothetical protein
MLSNMAQQATEQHGAALLSTIEQGCPDRGSWLDRLLGRYPGTGRRSVSADEDRPRTGRRVNRVALGCALAAFGLVIAAEMLPWMLIEAGSGTTLEPTIGGGGTEFQLSQLGTWRTPVYSLGWMVLLALVALALAVRPPARRLVTAAGFGWAGGQTVLLVGLAVHVEHGGGIFGDRFFNNTLNISLGPGAYAAFAAVALAALALAIGQFDWSPSRGRTPKEAAPEVEAGPIDLTVTPVPTSDPYR